MITTADLWGIWIHNSGDKGQWSHRFAPHPLNEAITGMGRVKRRAEIALAGQRTGETNWSPFFLDGEINLDCTWSNNNWDRIWIPHSGTEDEEWHMLGCVFGCIINCISGSAESTCVRSLLLLFVSDVEEGAVNIIRCPSTSCTYWLLTQYQMH